jgi:hypothetical protein
MEIEAKRRKPKQKIKKILKPKSRKISLNVTEEIKNTINQQFDMMLKSKYV